jgi:hypothetical protein
MLSLQGWLLDGWRSELVNQIGKDRRCCGGGEVCVCYVPYLTPKKGQESSKFGPRAATS